MLKTIKNLLERNLLLIAISITIAITLLSLLSINNFVSGIQFTFLDKFEHAFAYFVLALSWLGTFNKTYSITHKNLCICIMVTIFGILIEVLQRCLTTDRTFDYYDMLANTIGVFIAYFVFTKLKSRIAT